MDSSPLPLGVARMHDLSQKAWNEATYVSNSENSATPSAIIKKCFCQRAPH